MKSVTVKPETIQSIVKNIWYDVNVKEKYIHTIYSSKRGTVTLRAMTPTIDTNTFYAYSPENVLLCKCFNVQEALEALGIND